MADEIKEKLKVLAKRMDIAAVPDWPVKTTLQQTVQALKRHRDIYFTEALDLRPASIIITTLAAHAYRGSGGDLYEVLDDITDRMPRLRPATRGSATSSRTRSSPGRTSPIGGTASPNGPRRSSGGSSRPGPTSTALSAVAADSTRSSRRWPLSSGTVPPGKPAGAFHAGSWKAAARASSATARERQPWPLPAPSPEPGVLPAIMISMAATARGRNLTLAQQALGLRSVFPDARLTLKSGRLPGQGNCSPATYPASTPSRSPTRRGRYPAVRVLDPELKATENGFLPHTYDNGTLCLHDAGQWNPTMLIVDTIVAVGSGMAAALRDMAGHRRMVR